MYPLVPLGGLRNGELAQVVEIVGRPDQVQRMKELGLRSGVEVQMVHAGAPCVLRLHGHKLCFRGNESLNVLVRPVEAECSAVPA